MYGQEEEEDETELGYDEYADMRAKAPPDPPLQMTRPPSSNFIPPRKNMPVEVVAYDDPEDLFTRQEPTISRMSMSNTGMLTIDFSHNMHMLHLWEIKQKRDEEFFKNNTTLTAKQVRLLSEESQEPLVPMVFIKFYFV